MALTWFGDQVKQEMEKLVKEEGIRSFKVFMAYRGSLGSRMPSCSTCCRPGASSAR